MCWPDCTDGGAEGVFTKQTANKQTFMQVLLAKLRADNKFYAVKVLQKKVILKKKEVGRFIFCKV